MQVTRNPVQLQQWLWYCNGKAVCSYNALTVRDMHLHRKPLCWADHGRIVLPSLNKGELFDSATAWAQQLYRSKNRSHGSMLFNIAELSSEKAGLKAQLKTSASKGSLVLIYRSQGMGKPAYSRLRSPLVPRS